LTVGVNPTKKIFTVKLSHFITQENNAITIKQPSCKAKAEINVCFTKKILLELALGVHILAGLELSLFHPFSSNKNYFYHTIVCAFQNPGQSFDLVRKKSLFFT
jgi:hypothetical protein